MREQHVVQERILPLPMQRHQRLVRLAVPVITTIVPVRPVVLTAVRAITAQADLIERHVVPVHILPPPMQRHQRLVRLVQLIRIITAPVKVHVRLAVSVSIIPVRVIPVVRIVLGKVTLQHLVRAIVTATAVLAVVRRSIRRHTVLRAVTL